MIPKLTASDSSEISTPNVVMPALVVAGIHAAPRRRLWKPKAPRFWLCPRHGERKSRQAATCLRMLDLDNLTLRWRNAFGKRAPRGLPKALLSKFLICRLQADALGDLNSERARLLEGYAARGRGREEITRPKRRDRQHAKQ